MIERSAARRSKVVRFGLNRKVGGCGLTSGDIFAEDEGVAVGIADDELVQTPFSWLERRVSVGSIPAALNSDSREAAVPSFKKK